MNLYTRLILPLAVVASLSLSFSATHAQGQQQQTAQPAPAAPATTDLRSALNINDLAISMAESSLKLNPSLRLVAELSNALEAYLTKNCFGNLLQTLRYEGPPTNPDCIARMERLLEVYPDNPVAVCLRDGIEAKSCTDAYRNQRTEAFRDSYASITEIPDPALKVGLTAADNAKLRALEETLRNVNADYQKAATDEQKAKYMTDATALYDQVLSVACKITALKLEDPKNRRNEDGDEEEQEEEEEEKEEQEDYSIREAREKLLKIPPGMRPDYQRKMLAEAEAELERAAHDKSAQQLILKKIEVINNPDNRKPITAQGKLRVRIILPVCDDYSKQSAKIIPQFPSPTCHREGWYSPQCIGALRQWHNYKRQMQDAAAKRAGKAAAPTAHPIISSF
jgi:hypothetical protein